MQEVEEGGMVPLKGAKQPKNARDKWASSVDSKKDSFGAEIRWSQRMWAPRLEFDSTAIPWDALVQNFQEGHSGYIAEALE